jgi:hypothetical protein
MPGELVARTKPKPVHRPPDPTAAEARNARPPVDETEPTPVPAASPAADEPEPAHHHSNVVEFEAPVQRRTVGAERTVRADRPVTQSAARPPATEPLAAESLLGDINTGRVREPPFAPPARRVEPDAQLVQEPVFRRRSTRPESPLDAAPAARARNEPLPTVDIDRWPELPPPLDQPDGNVEVALRAWDRQQRLDREQTRL